MARFAVLASGNGSNFEALVSALGDKHRCVALVHDRKSAFVAERAARLGVPNNYVCYVGRERAEAEVEIDSILHRSGSDLIVLAGFMRLLSPLFVAAHRGRIVNVHPSLLPAWPGAGALHRSFVAGERQFGVTVHLVDEGMDSGPVLIQKSFVAASDESFEVIEERVHMLEHDIYPKTVAALLEAIDSARESA